MADSKKVMSWLEGLAEPDWMDCYSESEVQNTAIAALDLLDELLKEQEAKTPVECEDAGYWYYRCPTCGHHEDLLREWNYCPFCGQAVKWE